MNYNGSAFTDGVIHIYVALRCPAQRHTLTQLVSILCCLGHSGGLAQRRADGGEVERPTEQPGAILQRCESTIGEGYCAHQTAQQVSVCLL